MVQLRVCNHERRRPVEEKCLLNKVSAIFGLANISTLYCYILLPKKNFFLVGCQFDFYGSFMMFDAYLDPLFNGGL